MCVCVYVFDKGRNVSRCKCVRNERKSIPFSLQKFTLVMTRSCTIATQRYIVVPRYVMAIGFSVIINGK